MVKIANGVQSSCRRHEEAIPTSTGILTTLVAEQQGPKDATSDGRQSKRTFLRSCSRAEIEDYDHYIKVS